MQSYDNNQYQMIFPLIIPTSTQRTPKPRNKGMYFYLLITLFIPPPWLMWKHTSAGLHSG